MTYKLLLVDDEVDNLQLLQRTFRRKYELITATSGEEALNLFEQNEVDLVISDHKMPGMDGVDLLKEVYNRYPDTIRILITAYTEPNILINAINTGKIYRYIKKPWSPEEVTSVVESAIEILKLNKENQELVKNFKELFAGTIQAITEALDAKDSFTYGRSKRVSFISILTAKNLGLSDEELSKIELAGLLRDIGMIGVPEHILNKPSNLTPEEFEIIKNHVQQGVKILEDIKQLDSVLEIIKYHHERYDGNGYPNKIKGEDIPIGARIISVADAYDGMVSDRAYRKGLSMTEAVERIKASSGTQFDPKVVNAFLEIIEYAAEELKKHNNFEDRR